MLAVMGLFGPNRGTKNHGFILSVLMYASGEKLVIQFA